mmetsp:Transcript_13307/g.19034  ORF Transcript_13307/g.19034 Transcript_13307/m.19034 type:complete len:92 (-) Transcript_13307:579-854(-)
MFLLLHMLRQAPSEVHDYNSSQWYGFIILILNMAAIVTSVVLDTVMAVIIIDSFGPNGSYISDFFSHNDTFIHVLGLLLVRTFAVTAAINF